MHPILFPSNSFPGLDLSPYFLAVAKCRQEEAGWGAGRMNWVHGNAEALPMGDSSVDFVSLCFVFHELPQAPTRTIMAEVFRVLRPGGIVAFTDNDPESPVIQVLSAPTHFVSLSLSLSLSLSRCVCVCVCVCV